MTTERQDRDALLGRLSRFEKQFFPRYEKNLSPAWSRKASSRRRSSSAARLAHRSLRADGLRAGDLFIARNVGNLVPPWDMSAGFHGTAAAIRVRGLCSLQVHNIIVCGHSHCGAGPRLYEEPPAEATHLASG